MALRKLEDGIPNTALREIKALQEIEENENIVRLREVLPHGMGFVLVFEYILSDLSEVSSLCTFILVSLHGLCASV